jgi:hypothetical protein
MTDEPRSIDGHQWDDPDAWWNDPAATPEEISARMDVEGWPRVGLVTGVNPCQA